MQYVKIGVLLFITGHRGEETERRDREEETKGSVRGKETEWKIQRGRDRREETVGKRQRGRNRGKRHKRHGKK